MLLNTLNMAVGTGHASALPWRRARLANWRMIIDFGFVIFPLLRPARERRHTRVHEDLTYAQSVVDGDARVLETWRRSRFYEMDERATVAGALATLGLGGSALTS